MRMKFGWQTYRDRITRGRSMSPEKKLEGLRLMNELADKVLTKRQKLIRRKLREAQSL